MPFKKGNTFWKQNIGKKLSDNHKEKLSKAHKGKKITEETKEKMRNVHRGRKITWGKKISDALRGKQNPKVKGENNFNWEGDNVKYRSLHSWVQRWKGKADHCENCGTLTAKRYEWANIDHKYRRVLEDYTSMCTSCHKKYDFINFNKK